jgi:hypothetical protein
MCWRKGFMDNGGVFLRIFCRGLSVLKRWRNGWGFALVAVQRTTQVRCYAFMMLSSTLPSITTRWLCRPYQPPRASSDSARYAWT